MSIDTYLVIPVANPERAKRVLSEGGDDVTHIGRDYVVLYRPDLFANVKSSPEIWGPRYVQDLPPSIRRGLDPRGLLARPEVGQSFQAETYAKEVDSDESSLWLPLRRVARRRVKRLLLVALSPKREALLFERPELVRELITNRTTVPIPASIEFDDIWIELQRLLRDCLWLDKIDDVRADALAPRTGLSFLEDKDIDAARLVRSEQARSTAEWLATLTPEVVERARREPPSPASRNFPECLGSAEADDLEPVRSARSRRQRKVSSAELDEQLRRLQAFYEDVQRTGRSVLSVRFRE